MILKIRHKGSKIRGYSLVEMAVVMSIIAVISTIGVGAWLSTRGQAYADDAAETFVSAVRDAQNKAFAVTKNGSEDTKIWLVRVENNQTCFYEGSVYKNGAVLVGYGAAPNRGLTTATRTCTSANITLLTEANNPITSPHFIAFSTPFGEGYLISSDNGGSGANWSNQGGNRPAKDYAPTGNIAPSKIKARFTKGNAFRDVIIETNGDVYAG